MPGNQASPRDPYRAHVRARMSRDLASLAATITDELAHYAGHFHRAEKKRLRALRQSLTLASLTLDATE